MRTIHVPAGFAALIVGAVLVYAGIHPFDIIGAILFFAGLLFPVAEKAVRVRRTTTDSVSPQFVETPLAETIPVTRIYESIQVILEPLPQEEAGTAIAAFALKLLFLSEELRPLPIWPFYYWGTMAKDVFQVISQFKALHERNYAILAEARLLASLFSRTLIEGMGQFYHYLQLRDVDKCTESLSQLHKAAMMVNDLALEWSELDKNTALNRIRAFIWVRSQSPYVKNNLSSEPIWNKVRPTLISST